MMLRDTFVVGLFALGGFALVGCGSEPLSDEAELTQAEVGVAPEDVLLKEALSPTSAITVVRDSASGDLAISVRGKIGVDDVSIVKQAMLKPTFGEAYAVLHPELHELPEKVRKIGAIIDSQRLRDLAKLPPADLKLKVPEVPIQKNASAFNANACQDFGGGFSGYYPSFCSYQYNWHSICTYNTIGSRDESVGWNESPYNAKHSLSGLSWKPSIPAWNWYVTEWGGNYTKRYACLTLDGTNTGGNLGITHHDFYTDQILIGVDE